MVSKRKVACIDNYYMLLMRQGPSQVYQTHSHTLSREIYFPVKDQ
jgi:hypothetical protein